MFITVCFDSSFYHRDGKYTLAEQVNQDDQLKRWTVFRILQDYTGSG